MIVLLPYIYRILHQPWPQGTKGNYIGDLILKNDGKGRQTCEYLKI